jgi:hypothetical protein
MGWSFVCAGFAALALSLSGAAPGMAQPPARPEKTYTVTLDAEKDYFAAGTVRVFARSFAPGDTLVGEMDVTIRRTKTITVPADTRDLIFRAGGNVTARLRLTAATGAITVRPLSDATSASGIAWMLGRRNGIAIDRLVVEFKGK